MLLLEIHFKFSVMSLLEKVKHICTGENHINISML